MYKKIIIFLLGSFTLINTQIVSAQTKQDTINLLQQIGSFYLNKMYSEKNFDSAYKMWNNEMFLNLQLYIDPKSKGLIKDTALLIRRIRSNMIKYYKRIENFKVVEFTGKILVRGSLNMYMLRYLYSADFDKNQQQNETDLTFYFNKAKNSWSISDIRLVIINARFAEHYYKWKRFL